MLLEVSSTYGSVVDSEPKPVRFTPFSRIWFRIRIRENHSRIRIWKNHSGSGQLRIRNESEVILLYKPIKILQFLNIKLNLKIKIPLYQNKKFIISLYLIMTFIRREYKGKIYVQNIRKNSCRIRKRIRIRTKIN